MNSIAFLAVFCLVQDSDRAVNGPCFVPPFPFFLGKKTGGVNLFCNNKRGALIKKRPFH
jgi:hypothetical protein